MSLPHTGGSQQEASKLPEDNHHEERFASSTPERIDFSYKDVAPESGFAVIVGDVEFRTEFGVRSSSGPEVPARSTALWAQKAGFNIELDS